MEHKLLSAIYTDREAYEELNKYADREDFSDLGSILYDKAVVYYKQDINASFFVMLVSLIICNHLFRS